MVLYLLLSILSATFLLIILKSYIKWKVDTLHGIIINYWVAAGLAFMLSPKGENSIIGELETVWPYSMSLGFMFLTVFYITAKTTQRLGVGVASVASKMSMVIPIGAGLLIYDESLSLMKGVGLVLAIPAVVITSYPTSPLGDKTTFSLRELMLPLLLFFGAGLVDTAIKASQHFFMNEDNQYIIIMSIFGAAGIFGLIRLFYEIFILKKNLTLISILGGILLGVTNYFSLYFLLRCLAAPGSESSTVFAYVNIGVVISSFVTGLLLFSEKPDKNKLFGIVLAITAILILAFNQS